MIHHIPAAPGKLGSLRLYNTLAEKFNGKLDRTSAQQGIEWFAEHVEDAKQNPQHRLIVQSRRGRIELFTHSIKIV